MYKDQIRKALKRHDTGRWDWVSIDACLTGADSDLEPWGQQGIEILEANEHLVNCGVHVGKTVLGLGARLNLPPSVAGHYTEHVKARDVYLDRARELIAESGIPSDWTGSDWYFYRRTSFFVRWIRNQERKIDFRKTASEILLASAENLRPIEEDLERVDNSLAVLAGWKTYDKDKDQYMRCEEFEPGRDSVAFGFKRF